MVQRWLLPLALAGGCSQKLTPRADASIAKAEASTSAHAITPLRDDGTPPPVAVADAAPTAEAEELGVLQRSLDGSSEYRWPPNFIPIEGALRTPITPEDEAQAQVFEGFFDIDRVPRGKGLQGSWIEVKDGDHYILCYRPMPEHFDKVERQVIVRAVPYYPSGQSIMARHLRVVSMTLAEGETPRMTPTTTLPPPEVVRSRGDLRRRIGRWAQVVGTLTHIGEEGESGRSKIRLRLDDGAVVTIREANARAQSVFRPRLRTRVTLLGEVSRDEHGFRLGRVEICDGEVATCGVDEDPESE